MHQVFRRIFVLLSAILVVACAVSAEPGKRPFRVDDMLKVEGAGAALMDPKGKWVLFEKVRPYDQFTDFSFRTYAYLKSGHQVWRYDRLSGGPAQLLPGVDPEPHTYLQAFSPSGRYVSLMQYTFGDLKLVSYDLENERPVVFPATPAFSRTGEHNPIWINDHEIIYAALPDGVRPMTTSVRTSTGEMLAKAWTDAWHGKRVTGREVRTRPADLSAMQEPGRLIRVDAATGKEQVLSEGLFADLRLSPGGQYLAALSVSKPRSPDPERPAIADPRRYKLHVFNLTTGDMSQPGPDLEFVPYSLAWSPGGDRLAGFGWREGEDARQGRFFVLDLSSGVLTRFEHQGLDLASERERGWVQRPERVMFLDDALSVYARRIPVNEEQGPKFTFRDIGREQAGPADWYLLQADGRSQNLTEGLNAVSGVPIHSGNGQITVMADGQLYRIFADGRRERLVAELSARLKFRPPGTFSTHAGVVRPEFADTALFDTTDGGASRLVLVDFKAPRSAAVRIVEPPPGEDVTALAGSFTQGGALFRSEEGLESTLSFTGSDRPGESSVVARLNRHLADIDPGSWELVAYDVMPPDGEGVPVRVESCVLLPPGFTHGVPVPLVVDVYPSAGPRCKKGGARITYPDPDSPYIWAGKGYAYARLSTPQALIRTREGPIAGLDEVLDAGIDALVAEGIADPDRLVLTGFSQGGFSSLYMATQSDRFGAVIAMHSWADLFSHYFGSAGVLAHLYDVFGSFGVFETEAGSDFPLGTTPFADPEAYYRNSPVFLAPQISSPVLLVHSDMDTFAMSQFDAMYAALLRAGKDARYVRYWGEGHGLSSPANIRDLWSRIDAFLEDHALTP